MLEGQSIDALFPLGLCLGGGPRNAIFETEFQGQPAAIKLIPATSDSLPAHLAVWEKAKPLSHPALVSRLTHGETTLGDVPAAYLVMERTDDNLADLLTNRPLTPTEARDMLGTLLGALRYLHANGFAHGGVQPVNILASGDQLKISSDALVPGGDPSADCRAIGSLLKEAMGANRGARLPEPFAEIVRHTATSDPTSQWDLPQIEACLRGERVPEPPSPPAWRTVWWAAAAVVALLAAYIIWSSPSKAPEPVAETPPPVPAAIPDPAPPDPDNSSPFKSKTAARGAGTPATPAATPPMVTPEGVTKVLPDIPERARKTITGRVLVNVRVRVDSTGKVEKATLERPRSSKYLSARALAAAQSWKFPAGNPPQDWLLRFEIARQETLASAAKLGN